MATATCREDAAGPDGADAINADLPALACPFCGGVLPHGESICPHCGCLRPTTRRPAATLTGRSQEIEVLRARIDGARAGQGAVIGIAGPAGIGKTRLAEEAIAYAKEQGCADFFIRGFEPSANLPYWALIEALHFDLDADQDIDPRAGLPDLVQALRGAQELPAGSTTGFEARDSGINTRIYEAATAVMRTITTTRPLVVVADDLQWFDVPTLNLLRYAVRLAKTLPLVIVCSYREDGEGASAWRPVLEDAAREGLLTELRLEQLDPAAARRLALASAPAPLADRAIEEVLRLAEGVPFYITQLAYAYAVPHGEGRPGWTGVPARSAYRRGGHAAP
jgi:predicted ATPase